MEPQLHPGDEVEVTEGDFTNFRATIQNIEGEAAEVCIAIFGRVHGPIRIPLAYLRKVGAG